MRDIINVASLNDEQKHDFMQIDKIAASQSVSNKTVNLQTSTNSLGHKHLPRKFQRRTYLSQRHLYGLQSRSNPIHRRCISNRANIGKTLNTPSSKGPIYHCPRCWLINLSFFRILFFGIFISGGDVFSDFLQV